MYTFKLESLHATNAVYKNASWDFSVHIKLNCNYLSLTVPGSQNYKIEPPTRLGIPPFDSTDIIHYWMRSTKEFPFAGSFENPHPDCCPGPVTVTLKQKEYTDTTQYMPTVQHNQPNLATDVISCVDCTTSAPKIRISSTANFNI